MFEGQISVNAYCVFVLKRRSFLFVIDNRYPSASVTF